MRGFRDSLDRPRGGARAVALGTAQVTADLASGRVDTELVDGPTR